MPIGKGFVLIKSFRAKVTAVLVLFMCLSAAVTNLMIYQYSLKAQLDQLREKLMVIAQAAAMTVDGDTVNRIPLAKDGVNSPAYKSVEEKLMRAKELAPNLAYAYIVKRGPRPNILKFVIDVHFEGYRSPVKTAYPGELYDTGSCPEMLAAFVMPSADMKMAADKWGIFLSGYAPIYDKKGDTAAVLGVDMSVKDVYDVQRAIKGRAILILIFGVIFSALLSIVISNTVTSPIERLLKGTRYIATGDLQHRVKVENRDEIGELADSFNRMSANLYRARQTLLNYFYHTVQSLIRILEARDPYSKGHSDRVAEYSVKIAKEMGLPEKKIKLLNDAALLHDIGKLGIQDIVLNKKTDFTEEDMHTIRKHPGIGEDILKPVSLDKETLAVVRGHHERYDGKGYPDGLKGEEIDLLASIVSAADAYDAMTSHRAYRKNLDKEEALAQLRENSGSQFNPKVVDAFMKILER